MESVRKDIECCFGRLKGRWRLFKRGILFSSREKIDNAWFTACILHNMLHKQNGLDTMEETSDWVGTAGPVEHGPEAAVSTADEREPPAAGFEAARAKLVAHYKYCNDRKQFLWFKRATSSAFELCTVLVALLCCNKQWRHSCNILIGTPICVRRAYPVFGISSVVLMDSL